MIQDKIFLIYGILAVIKNRGETSVGELSQITHVPIEVLRRNFTNLNNSKNADILSPYEELQVSMDDESEEESVYVQYGVSEDECNITLNEAERNLYNTIMSHNQNVKAIDIAFKHIYSIDMNEEFQKMLINISSAVNRQEVLPVLYEKNDETLIEMDVEPLGIVFYEFESLFYIIGQYEDRICIYRIDRIRNMLLNKQPRKFIRKPDFSMEEYLKNMWGMEFGDEVKVKVKFLKEANVEHKVKRDIECRKNKIIRDFEDFFIYEDTIIGVNSFKSWLRSYGSSAIVLEPENIRREMIESARKMFEYYSSSSCKT